MLRFPKIVLLLTLPSITGALSPAFAQTVTPADVPARYLKVDAPYAQKLVLEAKTAHPELKRLASTLCLQERPKAPSSPT
jgi:hypothetical protein